jgi:LmbE family N-acetylglucosaminyl deacetylase
MIVLIISAHADDGEGAAGGIINQMIENEIDVHYVAFSIAEESVPDEFEKNIVEKECVESTKILGIPTKNVKIFKYPVRRFSYHRQEILEDLIKMKKEINPNICFTPSTTDIHQDHKVVCDETNRAFQRSASIYGYDFPWNVIYTPKLNLFYELSEKNLAKKILSLQCYKSQLVKSNNCFSEDYIRGLAIVRGNMIGVKYAEAFESIREIRKLKDEKKEYCL